MKSFAVLKDAPLAFTLRILALTIILSIVGVNLTVIQSQVQSLKRGSIWVMGFDHSESKDYAIVSWVSPEGQAKGISVGDIVLNPQAHLKSEIGVPVTFLIKSENAPVREVTFIPRMTSDPGYFFTMLGLSPRAIVSVQITFLWTSLVFAGLFSVVAFLRRLDAWLVFLVVLAFSHLCALFSTNPQYAFLNLFIPSTLIFFLIVFPTGKFTPRWSWLLVFLPLLKNLNSVFIQLGILGQTHSVNFPNVLDRYSTISFLIILWGIFYEYRNKFTLFQQRWVNWLAFGLILINIPSGLSLLRFLRVPYQIIYSLSWENIFHLSPFAYSVYKIFYNLGSISIFIVLGVVIYRYCSVFKPMEQQQMKWFVFGLIWSVGLFAILCMFILYYHSSSQDDKVINFSYIFDNFFILATEVTFFCVLLALFRYGLYDIDALIHRAFVYSGLMVVAGVVCLLSTMFVDSIFGKSGEQGDMLTLLISLIFIVVTFNPASRWLQKIVDEYFRSEEFGFAEIFYEFTPEMHTFFTMSELSKMLVEKSVEQFGVTYASVCLKNKDGKLQHIKTHSTEKKKFKPVIEPQTLAKLEEGKLVFPSADSTYSFIIPLALPRGRKPDLIGVLVLGQRLNGLGYSSAMMKKMKSFGQEIGKALYTARIQDQSHKVLARRSGSKPALQNK